MSNEAVQMSYTSQQSESKDQISRINFVKGSDKTTKIVPFMPPNLGSNNNSEYITSSVEELQFKVQKGKEDNNELNNQIRNKIAQLLQDFVPQEDIDQSLEQLLSHLSKENEVSNGEMAPGAAYKNDITNFLNSGMTNYQAIQNAFRNIMIAFFKESYLKIQDLESQLNHLLPVQKFNRLKGRFLFIVKDLANCISKDAIQSNQLIDMKIEGDKEGNIYFFDNYKNKTYRFGVHLNPKVGDLYIGTFHGKNKFGIGFHYPQYEKDEFETLYFGEYETVRQGIGIRTYEKGSQKYYGEFFNDQKKGKGIYYWQDSDGYESNGKYEGEIDNNAINGHGTKFYFGDKLKRRKYVGIWKDGVEIGDGYMEYEDGSSFKGKFVAQSIPKVDPTSGKQLKNSINEPLYDIIGVHDKTGIFINSKGDTYESDCFSDDFLEGSGKIKYENKDTYEGPWVKGVPHTNSNTNGLYTYAIGGVLQGAFREGRMTEGNKRDKEGNSFFGKWLNGMLNGPVGSIRLITGEREEGNFVNNELTGQGMKIDRLGNKWEGNWVNGKLQGPGILTYNTGGTYKGEFRNSLRHGQGNETRGNGEYFNGEFENDKFIRGICKQFMSDGSTYEGPIEGTTPHGKGIRSYPNIGIYDGMYENGVKSGQGTYTYFNIDTYSKYYSNNKEIEDIKKFFSQNNLFSGSWMNDLPFTGSGTLIDPKFGIYNGEMKEGKRSGKGKAYFINGHYYDGQWKDNMLDEQGKYYTYIPKINKHILAETYCENGIDVTSNKNFLQWMN